MSAAATSAGLTPKISASASNDDAGGKAIVWPDSHRA